MHTLPASFVPLALVLLSVPLVSSAQTPAMEVESSTAETLLQLHDDAGLVLFGTFGTGVIPASGAGTRLVWYPAKAAFRAGFVEESAWDDGQVGNYSTAFGADTEASGDYAAALGRQTTAQSYGSLVIGRWNAVSGTPEGWVATEPLFVAGNGTSSSSRSNALTLLKNGNLTLAGSVESESGGFVFPDGTVQTTAAAGGANDHGGLNGLGDDDHTQYVLADGVRSTTNGFAVTGFLNSGTIPRSGFGTRLMWYPGKGAFRAGHVNGTQWNDASVGDHSAALGINTTASGYTSAAMGSSTEASGDYSTAMGQGTEASGDYSTAMGGNTTASGDYSAALGTSTTASGDRATAMGLTTTAQAYASLVIGAWNTISGSTTSWVSTEPLFVAGNGSPGSRADALTLYKDGDLTIAGTLTENSDRRLKTAIRPLTGALDAVTALQPVRYRFRPDASRPAGEHIGLVAQAVQAVLPELVSAGADGFLSVSYSKLAAVLAAAVGEQQTEIVALRAENEAQQAHIDALEARLARIETLLAETASVRD